MMHTTESIILGGGCFWCIEAVFKRVQGVTATQPGYAGGNVQKPDYKQVCTGTTGHAEVVEVHFNPTMISLETILDVFWQAHDPTTANRQGNDVGTQYRSIILYTNAMQKTRIKKSLHMLSSSGAYANPPLTEIANLQAFWPAEISHKDYFENHREQGYCRLVIAPKLKKLTATLPKINFHPQ